MIGEEYGSENLKSEFIWVIDPLDGTHSFISGKPLFGTLISCLKNYKPIIGVKMVTKYLTAANDVINNSHFRYTSEFEDENRACLVFETKIDEIEVTGIDLIEWNDDGKMVKLSVFIRPLSAITKVGERMSKKLSEMT